MIQSVVFDFDGTLVLSNQLKHDGFFAIAEEFVNGPASMQAILQDSPGDRSAILTRFAAVVDGGTDPTGLIDRYSQWCEERIVACPERPGASIVLRQLREQGLRIYVNSATPLVPLLAVVNRRYPRNTFDGVYGGHGQKTQNLQAIMAKEIANRATIVLVGDGVDDYRASIEFGCGFVGVTGGTLDDGAHQVRLLSNLEDLLALLTGTREGLVRPA